LHILSSLTLDSLRVCPSPGENKVKEQFEQICFGQRLQWYDLLRRENAAPQSSHLVLTLDTDREGEESCLLSLRGE